MSYKNKFVMVFGLLVVLSMLLGACQPTTPSGTGQTEEAPPQEVVPEFKNPDTYVVITGAGEQETMDPAWMYDTASSSISSNIYEGLTWFNREKTEEYIPALATDWTQSEDGTVWTFTIRQGVKFHEGGTLEPHDVAYTIHRALLQGRIDGPHWMTYEAFFGPDLAMASVRDFAAVFVGKENFEDLTPEELVQVCEAVKGAVVADDAAGTVVFNLSQPVPWLLALTSQSFLGGILDMEWMLELGDWDGDCTTWQEFADPSAEDSLLFNQANGTGPYKFNHWTPGEETVMVAFEDYWRTEPIWEGGPSGPAQIKRVVIKNIDEWGTRLAMFEAGDADWIYVPTPYRPQLEPYHKTECNAQEECEEVNPAGYIQAFVSLPQPAETPAQLNWNINVEGGNPYIGSGELDGNGIPPLFFNDMHIRKAFNYCFDFTTMVNDALAGDGVQAQGPIPEGMMGYRDGEAPLYSYDLTKCEEEFKLADIDLDGIPAGEDEDDIWSVGFYMQIAYNTGNETRRLASEILKAGIEAVNPSFSIAVVGMPWPVLLNSRRQGKLPVYVGGWLEDYHDPHNWVHPFLHSQGAYGRIINMPPEMAQKYDDMIAEGAAETDLDARRAIYQQIQLMAQEDGVNIWMYQALWRDHFQTWIHGYYYNPAYGQQSYSWVYALSKVAP